MSPTDPAVPVSAVPVPAVPVPAVPVPAVPVPAVPVSSVLVTGATGTVGAHVVSELLQRGVRVRALVRDPERAKARLGADVELAAGDLADPASIRAALDGLDAVFLSCPNLPSQVEYECNVIDAAAHLGIRRLVKLGAKGARIGSPVAFWDAHARIEQHLETSGVPSVVLHPSTYASNLLAGAETIKGMGRFFAPAADAKIAMIDPRDVAAVAAVVLTEGGHEGRTYILTGGESVTYDQAAGQLSEALGRPVQFVDVPDAAARAGMVQAGLPEWIADQIVAVFGELRRGVAANTNDVVRVLTGHEPRTVADFASAYAGAFQT